MEDVLKPMGSVGILDDWAGSVARCVPEVSCIWCLVEWQVFGHARHQAELQYCAAALGQSELLGVCHGG